MMFSYRFLMRNVDTEKSDRRDRRDSREERNGRKRMKGRGRMHYRPDFSRSRSRSRTPPHWRAEGRKTISLAEYEGKVRVIKTFSEIITKKFGDKLFKKKSFNSCDF